MPELVDDRGIGRWEGESGEPRSLVGDGGINAETHEDGSVTPIAREQAHISAGTIQGLKSPLSAWGFTRSDLLGDGGESSFKRILFAVSASTAPCRATDLVVALTRDHGSKVFVIHFYERILLGRGAYIDIESRQDAEQLVSRVCAELERRGVEAEPWTERSYPWVTGRLIALAATACCADIVVIGGSRGKSALWAVLRGGVSHDVLHRSSVPVVVVP